MRRILFKVLAAHWAAVFVTLAAACAADPRSGLAVPLRLLGAPSAEALGGSRTAAFFAFAFSVVAVLFFWSFAESVLRRDAADPDATRPAFAASALVLTLLVLLGMRQPSAGFFAAVECLLAVNIVSFLAVAAEARGERGAAGGRGGAAHRMAAGAARQSLLSRLSGRTADEPGWRP